MVTQPENFLPEGYSIPSTSPYMKFQDGLNTFRILGKPIMGMEFWKANPQDPTKRVPVRRRMNEDITIQELRDNPDPKTGNPASVTHFWAMVVWNYNEKRIQILEIKQSGILKAIKSYIENPKWGSPLQYDINVSKSGSLMTTEYQVDHDPKEEVSEEIMKKFKETKIDLEALFRAEDPFETTVTIDDSPDAFEKAIEEAK